MNTAHFLRTLSPRFLLAALLAMVVVSCSSSRPAPATQASGAAQPITDLLAQADTLYAQREDIGRAREALGALRRARAIDPKSYDAAWRVGRAAYRLGRKTKDAKEREAVHFEGMEAGKAAAALQPGKPEGHFWYGANAGGYAQTQGPLKGIGYIKELRREMEAVLRIDEGYQGGSAYMALGRLDNELPEMLGGDRQRAVETLEKGLRFGAENSLLRLRLAQAYVAVKRPADARKQLQHIITMTPHPDFLPEHKDSVADAEQMLKTELR